MHVHQHKRTIQTFKSNPQPERKIAHKLKTSTYWGCSKTSSLSKAYSFSLFSSLEWLGGSEDNGLQLSHPDFFPRSDSENICEMSIATKPTQGLLLRSKPAFQVVLCLTPGLSGSRETIWRHNLLAETIPAESDCQPKRAVSPLRSKQWPEQLRS